MKRIFIYILMASVSAIAQTNMPPPHIINSAGKSAVVNGNYYAFNIGEPITGTGGNYYTQGFLQPDYKIADAFNATVFYGDESCQNAGDGYIVASAYNNHGSVIKYVETPKGDTTSTLTELAPGTYTLVIKDSTNQSISKVIAIKGSNEVCAVHAHNAFSPNNDGLNEFFYIDNIEAYPDNHVYIFNRWGLKVWDKASYDNNKVKWDGKDERNIAVTEGTYFYIIEIKGRKPAKNWVEITK